MAFYKDAFVKAVNNMVVDVKRDLKWFIEKIVTTHQTDEDPYIFFPELDKISEEIAFEVIKRSDISTGNEILRVPPINLGSNYLIFPISKDDQVLFVSLKNREKNKDKQIKPESRVTGSKKHGVKWKEGPARTKKEQEPQGQWDMAWLPNAVGE